MDKPISVETVERKNTCDGELELLKEKRESVSSSVTRDELRPSGSLRKRKTFHSASLLIILNLPRRLRVRFRMLLEQ